MKNILFALAGNFFILSNPAVFAQAEQPISDQSHNYVVIGAFGIENNAVKFTHQANHHHARFEINPDRNLFYVYVLSTDNPTEAISEAKKIRSETKYFDTWVYKGILGAAQANAKPNGIDINPVTEKKMEQVNANDVHENINDTANLVSPDAQSLASTEKVPTSRQTVNKAESGSDEIAGKNFLFKIFRSVDQKDVQGEVKVIDADKTKKIGTYKGNTEVKVVSPGNKSGEVSLLCEVFGYRKSQKNINYNAPAGDDISTDENNNTVIPFELVRLQKGDIAVMYNVYFFKDAGVMRPESRYEINSLLEMLKENPNYKIKIHGHTNGGAAGKIISLGESKNFFSLTDTRDGFGSAKKLSYERSKVIRDYLVANGIPETQMQIKAWGGKRPIHDKHHTRASENVRVEVEILEN